MVSGKHPTIALVHDYLYEYGGAERVLEALHELYPDAPVYVAFADRKALGIHSERFATWDIRESWLTKIPFYSKLFSPLRVLAPWFFRAFDLHGYDVVISSSSVYFSKAVKPAPQAVHITYCHTPPRSLYGYSTTRNWKRNPFLRWIMNMINAYLRVIDRRVSRKVDHFIANSEEVRRRIANVYQRESTVIHPPVNVPEELISCKEKEGLKGGYYLYVGRLTFAKHPELAIEACNRVKVPLKVAGTGDMLPMLAAVAGPTVEVLGAVSDQALSQLYSCAKALLYPVEDEDFGIVPVEAMGHGVPVIAHRSGGPLETVIDNKTGIFFNELTADSLADAINRFESATFDKHDIHQHATTFGKERFQREIKEFIGQAITEKRP